MGAFDLSDIASILLSIKALLMDKLKVKHIRNEDILEDSSSDEIPEFDFSSYPQATTPSPNQQIIIKLKQEKRELCNQVIALQKENKKLQQKNEELEAKETKCCICYENKAQIVLNCGHVSVCYNSPCFDSIKQSKQCPICRQQSEEYIKLYFV